jgi:hypothetical protein
MNGYVCHVGFYAVRYVFRCQHLMRMRVGSFVQYRKIVLIPKRYILMFKILFGSLDLLDLWSVHILQPEMMVCLYDMVCPYLHRQLACLTSLAPFSENSR